MSDSTQGSGWGYADIALYLAGIALLSASLTILWFGMRAVMGVGGFCAEGGAYVIAQHCPGDTAWLIPLAVFSGLGGAGLMGWEGSKLGAPWSGLVGLAWPALFISLGWNFLQFAFFPPEGMTGIQFGWLIPGILFVVMGAVPLVGYLPGGKSWKSSASDSTFAFADSSATDSDDDAIKQREHLLTDLAIHAADEKAQAIHLEPNAISDFTPEPAATASPTSATDDGLVAGLEKLDSMHKSGSLTATEFEKAKQALIEQAGKSSG